MTADELTRYADRAMALAGELGDDRAAILQEGRAAVADRISEHSPTP